MAHMSDLKYRETELRQALIQAQNTLEKCGEYLADIPDDCPPILGQVNETLDMIFRILKLTKRRRQPATIFEPLTHPSMDALDDISKVKIIEE